MSKDVGKTFSMGASIENAETLNLAGQNTPTNYLFGSTGTSGGLYNSTGQLLVQLHAGLDGEDGVAARLGSLGSVWHRAQLP